MAISPRTESATPATRLRSEFAGDADMIELVQLFVDEMPARAAAILESFTSGAVGDLRRLAHQLKGASSGYGFPTVGHAAAALEAAIDHLGHDADSSKLDGLRNQVDDLLGLCRRVSVDP